MTNIIKNFWAIGVAAAILTSGCTPEMQRMLFPPQRAKKRPPIDELIGQVDKTYWIKRLGFPSKCEKLNNEELCEWDQDFGAITQTAGGGAYTYSPTKYGATTNVYPSATRTIQNVGKFIAQFDEDGKFSDYSYHDARGSVRYQKPE